MLSTEIHLIEQLKKAWIRYDIVGLNSSWNRAVINKDISFLVKSLLFSTRNAAQVWSCKHNDWVEKQHFFIKKILTKQYNYYMLFFEMGFVPCFEYTLKLHFYYVYKVMRMNEERLPKIFATEVIKSKFGWYK